MSPKDRSPSDAVGEQLDLTRADLNRFGSIWIHVGWQSESEARKVRRGRSSKQLQRRLLRGYAFQSR